MRIPISFTALFVAGVQTLAVGQVEGTTSLRDWGLRSVDAIRFGEISLFREGSGNRLAVGRLSAVLPAPPPEVPPTRVPEMHGGVGRVAELIGEQTNRLGGSFDVFEKAPSHGTLRYVSDDPEGRRLRFEYERREGFCGFWIQLYDLSLPATTRAYCDARDLSTLLLWVRGERGGERISIGFADREREREEYSLSAGMLGEYTPAGRITREWQCARVPLRRFPPRLNRGELALLVLLAEGEEASAVELRGVAFAADPEISHPLLFTREFPGPPAPREKGVWVWNTDSLLRDPAAQDEFLSFLTREGFTTVYLAIPTREDAPRSESSIPIPAAEVRPLLRRLHALGIRSEALYGDKSFAERAHHPFLISSIRNLLEYNESSPPEERFTGVHLDVEPYLLPGFMVARRGLSKSYLELLEECRRLCASGSLRLSADIPFWYDEPDELRGERDLLERILDRVDLVVVMDYRTRPFGLDGILRQAEGELRRGAGRRPVMIGLETGRLPVEEIWLFRDAPTREPVGDGATVAIAERGESVEVRFIPEGVNGKMGEGGRKWFYWHATRLAVVPPEKVSFWTLGRRALTAAIDECIPYFAASPAFHGFALHHYNSLKELK